MGSSFIIDVLSGSGEGNQLGAGTLIVSSSIEIATGSQTSSSRFFSRQITGSIHTVDGRVPLLRGGIGTTPIYDGTTGQWLTDLSNTTVTAGSYTRATITVDDQGRITGASSNSSGGGGGGGEEFGWEAGNAGVIVTSGSVGIGYKPLPPGGEMNGQAILHVSASSNSLPGLLVDRPKSDGAFNSFTPMVLITSGAKENAALSHSVFKVDFEGRVGLGVNDGTQTQTLLISSSIPGGNLKALMPTGILKIRGPNSPDHIDINHYFEISSGTFSNGSERSLLVLSGAQLNKPPELHSDVRLQVNNNAEINGAIKVVGTSELDGDVGVQGLIEQINFKQNHIKFSSGTLPAQWDMNPPRYKVNSLRMFISASGTDQTIEMISLYSGSHSGNDNGNNFIDQAIFPESALSLVVNPQKADSDFKVFGGGTLMPSFMAIGVDGPRKKLVLMSGSESSGLIRESYDDRGVSLIVSGNVTGLGAGKGGGNFNSIGLNHGAALFQGDMFLSGALAGKFKTDDTQFAPLGAINILGFAGDHVGVLDKDARIREGNTGEGLFGSKSRFMVTGSHLAPSGSSNLSNMKIFPKPYEPGGPLDRRNFNDNSISLFHGDVFSSGSLYSFGGEIRLGRPSDGRTALGIGTGGAEPGYSETSYQVGLIQVNSLEIPAGTLEAGESVKIDEVTFNPNATHTVATEAVKYLITVRDKNNTARQVYDALLTGIYDNVSGNTKVSFTYIKNDITAIANTNTPAFRAFDSLEITAKSGNAGDVALELSNTSAADDIGSNICIRVMKNMLTV